MFSLYALWLTSPTIHIFYSEDTTSPASRPLEEYDGQPFGEELIVTDIRIRNLPNYTASLVVEVKPLD